MSKLAGVMVYALRAGFGTQESQTGSAAVTKKCARIGLPACSPCSVCLLRDLCGPLLLRIASEQETAGADHGVSLGRD